MIHRDVENIRRSTTRHFYIHSVFEEPHGFTLVVGLEECVPISWEFPDIRLEANLNDQGGTV